MSNLTAAQALAGDNETSRNLFIATSPYLHLDMLSTYISIDRAVGSSLERLEYLLNLAKQDFDNKCFVNAKEYIGEDSFVLSEIFENLRVLNKTFIKLFGGSISYVKRLNFSLICVVDNEEEKFSSLMFYVNTPPDKVTVGSEEFEYGEFKGESVPLELSELIDYVKAELVMFAENTVNYNNLRAYAYMIIKASKVTDYLGNTYRARVKALGLDKLDPYLWYTDSKYSELIPDIFTNPQYDVTDNKVDEFLEAICFNVLRSCENTINGEVFKKYSKLYMTNEL